LKNATTTPATDARRDEHLRRSLIDCARRLGDREADGWVSGSKLAIAARDANGVACDDEAHAIRLLTDVWALELSTEKARQPTGGIGAPDLRHRRYKITDKGWQLILGQIDTIPGVAGRDD
jgi:hypothetical protein